MKIILLFIVLLVAIPSTVYANLVWPALYTEQKLNAVPIITLSLLIEFLVIRCLFKVNYSTAFKYVMLANIASGIFGLFLRPLSGLVWEISFGLLLISIFDWGTFNPVTWFFVPIIGGALNAYLELLTIKIMRKEKWDKKSFLVFWVANWFTVGLAVILMIFD